MAVTHVLGIDGGGSKTVCALFTADGAVVDFLSWGTTSHEFLKDGYEGVRRELRAILRTLTERTGVPVAGIQAVMGLAGVDCRRQAALFTEMALELGLGRALVVNDSLLGIQAGTAEGCGIAVCNGTGTGVSGIDPEGRTASAGALFELSGDYAGGKILGVEAVRAVYDQWVRGGPPTTLTSLLLSAVGAGTWEAALETIVCGYADGSIHPKDFAPLLFAAAAGGDGVAAGILQKSGEALARDVLNVHRALRFPPGTPVPVVLLGSLFTKAACPVQIDAMKNRLSESGIPFSCRLLTAPPVVGAVRWGLALLGTRVEPESIQVELAALEAKRNGGISHEDP